MRTNIVLDDDLVREGLKLTKLKTKKELINFALKELIARKKRKKFLNLEGKVEWVGDLNKMREGKIDSC